MCPTQSQHSLHEGNPPRLEEAPVLDKPANAVYRCIVYEKCPGKKENKKQNNTKLTALNCFGLSLHDRAT